MIACQVTPQREKESNSGTRKDVKSTNFVPIGRRKDWQGIERTIADRQLSIHISANHSLSIPISEKAIVAPTVPAPIMATREAVGVGIALLA